MVQRADGRDKRPALRYHAGVPFLPTFAIGAAIGMGLWYALGRQSGPRADFARTALSFEGTPYQWGGGHGGAFWGVDCSGLVLQALEKAAVYQIAPVYTADSMWRLLPAVASPEVGDLALYGTEAHVHHVAIITGDNGDGTYSVVSSEGDQQDDNEAYARANGHGVKQRPTHLFMSDFLGFRRLVS